MNWIHLQSHQLPYTHEQPYMTQGYMPMMTPTQYYRVASGPSPKRTGIATPPCDEPIYDQRSRRRHYRNNDADTNSSDSFENSRDAFYDRLKETDYSFGISKPHNGSSDIKPRRESFYRQEDALVETIIESCKITPPGSPIAAPPPLIIKKVQEQIQKNIQAQVEPITATIGNVMKEKLDERKSALKKELKPVVMREINTTIQQIDPIKSDPIKSDTKVTFKEASKEAPKEASKEAPKEASKEAPKEASKEAPKEAKELNQSPPMEMSYNAILPPEQQIDHGKYNVLNENRLVVLDFIMGEQIQQIDGRLIYIPRQEIKLKVAPYIHTDDTDAFKQDIVTVASAVIASKS